jgi:tight adherence protein B
MSNIIFLILVATVLTAGLAALYITTFSYLRWRLTSRVGKVGVDKAIGERRPANWRHISTFVDRTKWGRNAQERLRLADLDISPTIFLAARLVLIAGLYLAVQFILEINVFVNLIVSLAGAQLITGAYLRSRQDHYVASFDAQMPEVALLMGNSLRAGLAVLQAFEVVAERMQRPAGREFDRLAREIRLGKGLDEAMLDMFKRLPSEELRMMVTTILIQRVAGGNLAHALSVMSEAITARFKLRDEVRTMTAEARYSGLILVVMPIVVLGILNRLMEGAVGQFLSNPLGWIVGGLFVGVMVLAFTLIGRVSRVQV